MSGIKKEECPDLDMLRRFLMSDEVDFEETQLDTCAECQSRLESLTLEQQPTKKPDPTLLPEYLQRLSPANVAGDSDIRTPPATT